VELPAALLSFFHSRESIPPIQPISESTAKGRSKRTTDCPNQQQKRIAAENNSQEFSQKDHSSFCIILTYSQAAEDIFLHFPHLSPQSSNPFDRY